jgi:hypothetical protein
MTDRYFKIYKQFEEFSRLISDINLQNESDYLDNNRNDIYDRLRLPMRMFKGTKQKYIDSLINDYFNIDEFVFSVIDSEGTSRIHSDTYYKKEPNLQRYCNFAFPLSGDFNSRLTYWPILDKLDAQDVFKNSFLKDENLHKYVDTSKWHCSILHKQYQPVLLNTGIPHGVIGKGKSLFAYITIIGKTYEECADLYDAISSSATI